MPHPSRLRELLTGCRDELPILLGVVPFGMIYGILALDAGLSPVAAQSMSSVVFAGSAQLVTAQHRRGGVPGLTTARGPLAAPPRTAPQGDRPPWALTKASPRKPERA